MPETAAETSFNPSDLPYPPSWFDRFIGWIEGLPGPIWVFYALVIFAFALLINAMFWFAGIAPVGSFDPIESSFAILMVYWVALYHYLTRIGSRALHAFRPLLEVDDSEMGRLDYQLATLPRRLGWWAIFVGVALQVAEILGQPTSNVDLTSRSPVVFVGDMIFTTILWLIFIPLIIRSIRQLRMVSNLHARARNINLLDLGPAHAFAALTSRTGIGVILVLVYGYIYEPSTALNTAWDVFVFVAVALLAIVIFVGPLVGMRRRLEEEKDRSLVELNGLLQTANDRLHGKIRSDDNANMRAATSAIAALMNERELLQKTSTWPWDTRTIRGFASTLLLPIFLLLVSQLFDIFF